LDGRSLPPSLRHQHVHCVDDPRNVPENGEQETDPELHLIHPHTVTKIRYTHDSKTAHQIKFVEKGEEDASERGESSQSLTARP
jgi:hypothetical protein